VLQVINVEKSYGDRTLFKGVSFSLTPGERLALVGRNGTGKSTLFKLILEEDHPDEGEVILPKGYRVGHLSQHLEFNQPTILREACLGLPPDRMDEEYKAEIILSGLGFSIEDFERPASSFSGGFQIRLELARVLLSEPNLLLLDEPTNYLDIVSARWLERFLCDWEGELIMISHDRAFLDAVSTHTMIIHRGKARRVQGRTQKLYDLLAEEETIHEQTRLNQEKKRKEVEQFVNKFKAKAGTASLAQSRMKMLEKMEVPEELIEVPVLDFNFTGIPFFGKSLIELENGSFSFPPTPSKSTPTEIIKDFTVVVRPGDRIGVIGKNGKGKSTLLRLLASELKLTSGEIRSSPHTKIGYFGQTNIQRLSKNLTVEEEIASTNHNMHRTRVRSICGTMMFTGDDGEKKISVLSGGEKSRVLLGKLIAQPSNLLLLDEPTNHLDLESIAALVDSLAQYEGAVMLVTHDEFMLRKLATRLIVFSDEGVNILEGNYDYFLSRGGWGDGDDTPSSSSSSKPAAPAPAPAKSSNLDRKDRAKQRQDRSKVIGPLEKEIASVEKQIVTLEESIKRNETLMAEAASASQGAKTDVFKMAELSRETAAAKKRIDELFETLEDLSSKLTSSESEFS
jgi:ATP-binding cassette subfamily F protein 3